MPAKAPLKSYIWQACCKLQASEEADAGSSDAAAGFHHILGGWWSLFRCSTL